MVGRQAKTFQEATNMLLVYLLTEGPARKSDPTSAQRPQSANQSLARWKEGADYD